MSKVPESFPFTTYLTFNAINALENIISYERVAGEARKYEEKWFPYRSLSRLLVKQFVIFYVQEDTIFHPYTLCSAWL